VILYVLEAPTRVAIGRVVLTNREHIIALEPLDKGLVGTLLRYPYEVRGEAEYFDDIQDVKVTAGEEAASGDLRAGRPKGRCRIREGAEAP